MAVCLLPFALLYGAVSGLRRTAYRLGLLKVRMLPVPVIVVGNLIAGGAGKTPTVIAVVALLRRHGYTPGIISRGYGRDGHSVVGVGPETPVGTAGDEPLLLRLATGAPVFVGRDRVAAGMTLLRQHPEVDIVVSDDGLQHLRLGRTAQVLVFDERGTGNGWLLPAGPLRQRLPASMPARTAVLYNSPQPSTPLPGSLARRGLRPPVELRHWRAGQSGNGVLFSTLSGRRLIAAAGLAHPERFFDMLRNAGLSFTTLPLPDHFDYARLPWPADSTDVLVTEKDAIKLDPARLGATRVWVVALDFDLDAEFEPALLRFLPPLAPATARP